MTKHNLDQASIRSVFTNESDLNVSVVLRLLEDEGFETRNLRLHFRENGSRVSPLDLYLHAVFQNKPEITQFYIDQGYSRDSRSTPSAYKASDDIIMSRNLGTILNVDGANDVCWAVMSNAYNARGEIMDVNARGAILRAQQDLKDAEAQKHMPLDIAVMMYIAQRIRDEHREQCAAKIKNSDPITNLIKRYQGVAEVVVFSGFKPKAHDMENKIHMLLASGAYGSKDAYFATSDNGLDDPINNKNAEFEKMNLAEFCGQNAAYLPAGLARNILNVSAEINCALDKTN